ncbi:MAG: U32 family peptidase [Ruminococcaceae bacterium]|nr:U32 family peptidase [Oscillospiraceae bacterium]
MIINKPELLSPVGDMERLDAALNFGADAIYIGGNEFGMRAAAANFGFEQMKKAAEAAHALNKRIYLTCNTLPTNSEMDRMQEYLKNAALCGVDAFIVSDVGVLSLLKKTVPDAEVHISTQAGIVNYASANTFYEMGAKRVVLARELCFDDIKTIRDKTNPDLELETFVHGAMCMSFSGRCTISNYMTNRDANRGECSQPCRWQYYLMEQKRPGEYFPVFEEPEGTYILNSKDMCMIEHIDKLCDAGISSLKIEGRAKSSYYVAVVTNAYRNVLDYYLKNGKMPENENSWMYDEVYKVSHREYTTGFYFGRPENGQCYQSGGYVRNYDIAALADDYKDGKVYFTSKNGMQEGQIVEILSPQIKPFEVEVKNLCDVEGKPCENANHPMSQYSFDCSVPVAKGSIIRIEK